MGQVGWIKLSTDIFSNRKIKILLKEKDGDTYFRLWIQILTIAGECNRNGGLYISDNVPFKIEDFTNIIGKSSKTFTKVFRKFIDLGMLIYKDNTYFIKNWNKYQSLDRQEDYLIKNRERQRRFSEKLKKEHKKQSPFTNFHEENIHYCTPKIACFIEYLERSRKNHLRHPVYRGTKK